MALYNSALNGLTFNIVKPWLNVVFLDNWINIDYSDIFSVAVWLTDNLSDAKNPINQRFFPMEIQNEFCHEFSRVFSNLPIMKLDAKICLSSNEYLWGNTFGISEGNCYTKQLNGLIENRGKPMNLLMVIFRDRLFIVHLNSNYLCLY